MTITTVPNHQASTGFSSKHPPPFRNLHIQVCSHWFLRNIPGSPKKSLTTFFCSLVEAPEWVALTDIVNMRDDIRSSLQKPSIFNLYLGYAWISLLTFTVKMGKIYEREEKSFTRIFLFL